MADQPSREELQELADTLNGPPPPRGEILECETRRR